MQKSNMDYIKYYIPIQIASLNSEILRISEIEEATIEEKVAVYDLIKKKNKFTSILNQDEEENITREIWEDCFKYIKSKHVDQINEASIKINEIASNLLVFREKLNEIHFDNFQEIETVVKDINIYLDKLGISLLHPNAIFPMGIQVRPPSPQPKRKNTSITQEQPSRKRKKETIELDLSEAEEEEEMKQIPKITLKREDVLAMQYGKEFDKFITEEEVAEPFSANNFYPSNMNSTSIPRTQCSDDKVTVIPKSSAYLAHEGKMLSVGKGAVASVPIKNGDKIICFHGNLKTATAFNNDVNSGTTSKFYVHYAGKIVNGKKSGTDRVLDCYSTFKKGACKASAINSANNLQTLDKKRITPNCELHRIGTTIYLKAIKDIAVGEELFFAYGVSFSYKEASKDLIAKNNLEEVGSSSSS